MWSDEVEQALAAGPSDDLAAAELDNVRSWRAACQAVEAKVSFLRRMIQGRLDIVTAERRRRAEGGNATDLASLVDELPRILADRPAPAAPGAGGVNPGRLPTSLMPPDDDSLTVDLDAIVDPASLGTVVDLPDERLDELDARLSAFEAEVSRRRKALFGRIDQLAAELARRYRTGEATVGASPPA